MPEASPLFSVATQADGSLAYAGTIPAGTQAKLTAINWVALLQAIVAAIPAILAIISAFTGAPSPPTPAPTPKPGEPPHRFGA